MSCEAKYVLIDMLLDQLEGSCIDPLQKIAIAKIALQLREDGSEVLIVIDGDSEKNVMELQQQQQPKAQIHPPR